MNKIYFTDKARQVKQARNATLVIGKTESWVVVSKDFSRNSEHTKWESLDHLEASIGSQRRVYGKVYGNKFDEPCFLEDGANKDDIKNYIFDKDNV